VTALEELRQRLVNGQFATPVVLGRSTPTPDAAIFLQTYSGGPGVIYDANTLPLVEFVAFQALSRAPTQKGAEEGAQVAYRVLPGRHLTLGGTRYDWIVANHRPSYVGADENGRSLVVVNFTARRRGPASEEQE
jgi:hypothetical protein